MATILSIPATYATAFGFIFAYGRVIIAMAKSGLFPPVFLRTYGQFKTPYVAFIFGSVVGYAVVVLVYFVPIVQIYLFNMCILSGFVAYISQLIGFILFRRRYASTERLFISPLGIPGAVYGIIMFSLFAISVMGFQKDDSIAFITFLVGIIISTIYYFLYAKTRQKFSVEEHFIFVQQIVKFNQRARLLATRGHLKRKPFNLKSKYMSYKSRQMSGSSSGNSLHSIGVAVSRNVSQLVRDMSLDTSTHTRTSSVDISRLWSNKSAKTVYPEVKNQTDASRKVSDAFVVGKQSSPMSGGMSAKIGDSRKFSSNLSSKTRKLSSRDAKNDMDSRKSSRSLSGKVWVENCSVSTRHTEAKEGMDDSIQMKGLAVISKELYV
jgi:hypothetical protein